MRMPAGEPWRVRFEIPSGRPPCQMFDAETGRDTREFGVAFPRKVNARLLRSLYSGRPVLVYLFCLDERGAPYLQGDDIAKTPRWVQVVP